MNTVSVPPHFNQPFEQAEDEVAKLFGQLNWRPYRGSIHVGKQRYVMIRAESLYHAWFQALAQTFGEEVAGEFIYNTAREIGRSDSASFSAERNVSSPVERLAAGPIHFAYTGWAFVEILADSVPATDDSYFLHYNHPNTFESEVLTTVGQRLDRCGCLFSAGYSSGWCSEAFGIEVHGREVRCIGRGDKACEFIMAPEAKLEEHAARLRAACSNE
jgi:predicted hydrocarbon binding protein